MGVVYGRAVGSSPDATAAKAKNSDRERIIIRWIKFPTKHGELAPTAGVLRPTLRNRGRAAVGGLELRRGRRRRAAAEAARAAASHSGGDGGRVTPPES